VDLGAGAAVVWLEEVDSTNAEAARRAEAGTTGPLWIAARRQTAGRGRRGRTWMTGDNNLAATFLITLDLAPSAAAGVSFVAALAVADLVQAAVPETPARLKWPNDVLLDGGKVAGILVESGRAPAGGLWLAIGVGVNLAVAPEATERPATSLAAYAPPPTPQEALDHIVARMADWLRLWTQDGLKPILTAWCARSTGIPGPCVARLGDRTIEGYAEGLDSTGALRLRSPSGDEQLISAGDVFFGGA